MADFFGAATDLISGVGNYLGAQATAKGAEAGAASAKQAAQSYAQAAKYALVSSDIKQAMISRDLYKTLGGIRSSASASGLQVSGSALDLIRDSTRQGAIAKAIVGLQGDIDYSAFMGQSNAATAQANAATAQAKAAKKGGFLGAIGSAVGIIGSLFSDDALKQDIELVRRRGDGIGVYHFRYAGSNVFFEGAMAADVEAVRPDAIYYDEDLNLRMVDYDAIKMDLRRID